MRALACGNEEADATKREARRRAIHAQLLKQSASSASASSPSLSVPDSSRTPRSPQEEAFDRALFEGNTLRKSLGATLLSENLPSRRSSTTQTLRPERGDGLVRDDRLRPIEFAESDAPPFIASGLTGSISETSSEVSSLPPFPDVPTTSYAPDYPFAGRSAVINAPPIAIRSADDAVEELALALHRRTPKISTLNDSRLSLTSDSGLPQYQDADEDSVPVSFHEVPVAPIALAPTDGADDGPGREKTREWIIETLATGIVHGAAGRTLGDIAEGDEEEVRLEPTSLSASFADSAPTVRSAAVRASLRATQSTALRLRRRHPSSVLLSARSKAMGGLARSRQARR